MIADQSDYLECSVSGMLVAVQAPKQYINDPNQNTAPPLNTDHKEGIFMGFSKIDELFSTLPEMKGNNVEVLVVLFYKMGRRYRSI